MSRSRLGIPAINFLRSAWCRLRRSAEGAISAENCMDIFRWFLSCFAQFAGATAGQQRTRKKLTHLASSV